MSQDLTPTLQKILLLSVLQVTGQSESGKNEKPKQTDQIQSTPRQDGSDLKSNITENLHNKPETFDFPNAEKVMQKECSLHAGDRGLVHVFILRRRSSA